MKHVREMTDDDIADIVHQVARDLGITTEEEYDLLWESLHEYLKPFSNGYVNHN